MQSMTFKQVMDRDVDETFLNVAEFADLHNIDGNNVPALIDDMENIEREKRMKSNMDGIHARQVLLYVKASVFPSGLPAQKRLTARCTPWSMPPMRAAFTPSRWRLTAADECIFFRRHPSV